MVHLLAPRLLMVLIAIAPITFGSAITGPSPTSLPQYPAGRKGPSSIRSCFPFFVLLPSPRGTDGERVAVAHDHGGQVRRPPRRLGTTFAALLDDLEEKSDTCALEQARESGWSSCLTLPHECRACDLELGGNMPVLWVLVRGEM